MALSDLPRIADQLPWFGAVVDSLLSEGTPGATEIEGLTGSAKGFVLARLFSRVQKPMLVVTYQHEQAQRLWDDLIRFGVRPDQVCVLPASQNLFLEGDVTDHRIIGERINALISLASGAPCIVIGTLEAILQRTSGPRDILDYVFTVRAEESIDVDGFVRKLVDMGYDAATTVTRPGEFSRRGGILDLFPGTSEDPIRIELFGDEIESIRPFDITTQRSIGRHAEALIAPAREIRLDQTGAAGPIEALKAAYIVRRAELIAARTREATEALERLTERLEWVIGQISQGVYMNGLEQYSQYLSPAPKCALDYLPADSVLVFDELHQAREHLERTVTDIRSARERQWERGEALDSEVHILPLSDGLSRVENRPTLLFTLLARSTEIAKVNVRKHVMVNSAPSGTYRGNLNSLADEVGTWLANECRVVFVSDQPIRVREICAELKLPVRDKDAHIGSGAGLFVTEGRLRAGFTITDIRLYVLTDAELFGSARPVVNRRKVAGGVAISSVLDLREMDYVVHIHHGIGLYRGLVKRRVNANERDYLLVEYQGGDRLYVPADQIDRIQRYVGADGTTPQVNKIGGSEWQRTTRKVREQARQIAGELIQLYAARHAATRPSFGADTNWQSEMEDAFPYEETPDQLRAINDIKTDLENVRPMDRLICGDVGFGKTEVALRGAFKVVTAGKQVAVLCPTTVLAAQHLSTFTDRLAAYPIQIELLSRFRTKPEQAKTIEKLKAGSVDIVIATHRLFSKDVSFANLGLVIVDEEQRFGVAHKEKLKQLRTQVDVLTLSATPIPRTLSMALSGLRDMSVIEDPPEGRTPVLTYVREYDDNTVRDAILRELEREGQIYFVHNRVESIYHVAAHLKKLAPDARILVGHGQMSEDELERVMYDFYHHEADILVCTTIIENGLDVSNTNTILIDNSDHMGLSQLYQLRGRVGRSNRQAYAYLFYRRHKQLTEVAERRLAAMREFSALGSGYKVAMRDLEIRGAGNLLGAEQHGAMISVGFDLYTKLLAQAVQELKGEEVTEDILPPVDLPITAFIPDDYIPGEAERIYFYKRMSSVRTSLDVDNLQAELEDRFGDPPKPVWEALGILRLRLRCKQAGIAGIKSESTSIVIRFAPQTRLSPDAVKLLTFAFKNHRFTPDGVIVPITGTRVIEQVEETLSVLDRAIADESGRPGGSRDRVGAASR